MKKYGNVTMINQRNKTNHDIVTIRRTYRNFSSNSLLPVFNILVRRSLNWYLCLMSLTVGRT